MKYLLRLCCILFFSQLGACVDNNPKTGPDSPVHGSIDIVVDESFEPVIRQQIEQYQRLHPGTEIKASYLPEASCLKELFFSQNNRMAILARNLSFEEEQFFKDSLTYLPRIDLVAFDAITIINNRQQPDSLFTKQDLKNIMLGKGKPGIKIVFDGLSATSTVRYIKDSLLLGQAWDTSIVKAAKNSQAVVDFVAENPNTIGLVGISWVGNPEIKAQVEKLKSIRIAYVQCDLCDTQPFVKPLQESITSFRYPLVRNVYTVLKENYNGLGNGFAAFLKYEQGQLIFRRSYLRPVMEFRIRNVRLTDTIGVR